MAASNENNWRELCAAATVEPDSDKLFSLVSQILQVFEEGDHKQRSANHPSVLPCQE